LKITAIIQARMGSSRLPGKVLMDLGGETVLSRVVRRLRRASRVHEIITATTESPRDAVIVEACDGLGVPCFRGSEQDVLDRYFRAAEKFGADAVVRITSDCPLIDPALVDEVIQCLVEQHADFACNVMPRTYPRGLDAEVFTVEALRKAWQISDQPHQREHVTPLFYERSDIFRFASVRGERDYSQYRWTLDTPEDLCLIRAIYGHFENGDGFGWRETVALMEWSPELANMNAHVVQKRVRENTQTLHA
jgi:spore coat polysaccharide biosynthesis protein SpsF